VPVFVAEEVDVCGFGVEADDEEAFPADAHFKF
jgi:hypothetical protein